jgi:hypothetical protein
MSTKGPLIPPVENPLNTDEKREKIKLFREKEKVKVLLKEEHSDDYLSRWLGARNWEVEAAVELFEKSMIWRKENNIDTILEWYPKTENFKKMWNYWPCCHDVFYTREGWPFYCERVGIVDFTHLFTICTPQDLVNFHIYEAEKREKLRFQMEKEHGFTVGTVFLHDFTNLGLRHIHTEAVNVFRQMSLIDQYNYPESVRKSFEINTPTVFSIIWGVVSHLLDPGLVAKLLFYGNNFQEDLLSIIPEDQLPTWAGGAREDVAFGGDLLVQKFLSEGTKIEVPASKSVAVELIIEKNQTVDWKFISESHDIDFHINYHKEEGIENISKHERVKSGEGTFIAEFTGTYSLVFDNTFSWTRKKVVTYQSTVVEI